MSRTGTLAVWAWVAALSSTAGLVYAVHRPLVAPPAVPTEGTPTAAPTPNTEGDQRSRAETVQSEMVLAPIRITARPTARRTFEGDVVPLRCEPWRAVSQGPQGREVRYCE